VLESLFDLSSTGENKEKLLGRQIIIGSAGIGKTTLCQRIVYLYTLSPSEERIWKNQRFKLLIWLPLRVLQGKLYISLAEVIHTHCLLEADRKIYLVETVQQLLNYYRDKTLFLLDGYDEIAAYLEKKDSDKLKEILKELRESQYWLITSRPNAVYGSQFYHDKSRLLENIGFNVEQILKFIDNYFETKYRDRGESDEQIKVRANPLKALIKQTTKLAGAARIPVNLQLICYLYSDAEQPEKMVGALANMTLTELYTELNAKLAVRYLTNEAHNPHFGKYKHSLSRLPESILIEPQIKPVLDFIEYIAWWGMQNNQNEFSFAENQNKALFKAYQDAETVFRGQVQMQEQNGRTLNQSPIDFCYLLTEQLGMLAVIGHSEDALMNKYLFHHMSFQEYFAARYLVAYWSSGEQSKKDIAIHFIQERKHDQGFQYVFWFIVGLLSSTNNNATALNQIFEIFFQAPQDLLRHHHEALFLMRCLEEGRMLEILDKNHKDNIWRIINSSIEEWFNSDYNTIDYSKGSLILLQYPMVMQSSKVKALLLKKLENCLAALPKQSQLNVGSFFPKLLALHFNWILESFSRGTYDIQPLLLALSQHSHYGVGEETVHFLEKHFQELKADGLQAILLALSQHLHYGVGKKTVHFLENHFEPLLQELKADGLQEIFLALSRHPHYGVGEETVHFLENHFEPLLQELKADGLQEILLALLRHTHYGVGEETVHFLEKHFQELKADGLQEILLALSQHPYYGVGEKTVHFLEKHFQELKADGLQAILLALSQHPHYGVGKKTVHFLENHFEPLLQELKADGLQEILLTLSRHPHYGVGEETVHFLEKHFQELKADGLQEILLALSQHLHYGVGKETVHFLENHFKPLLQELKADGLQEILLALSRHTHYGVGEETVHFFEKHFQELKADGLQAILLALSQHLHYGVGKKTVHFLENHFKPLLQELKADGLQEILLALSQHINNPVEKNIINRLVLLTKFEQATCSYRKFKEDYMSFSIDKVGMWKTARKMQKELLKNHPHELSELQAKTLNHRVEKLEECKKNFGVKT
jgi:uroporphyrinogen-III synthase